MTAIRSPFDVPDEQQPFTLTDAQPLVDALKILADPVRLVILHQLTWHGPLKPSELQGLGLTQPGVAHHLRALREAGLITDAGPGSFREVSLKAVRELSVAIDPEAERR